MMTQMRIMTSMLPSPPIPDDKEADGESDDEDEKDCSGIHVTSPSGRATCRRAKE